MVTAQTGIAVAAGATHTGVRRPLVMTADPGLLDELVRLCAIAGVEPVVVTDVGAGRAEWERAPLVLLGPDAAERMAVVGLPRRDDVLLVTRGPVDGSVWRSAVAAGAAEVLDVGTAEAHLVERIGDAAEPGTGGGRVVGVLGARGGVGTSTLAVALAVTAARDGHRALLVDGDPLGGGLDLVLGAESVAGVRWADLTATRGRLRPSTLVAELPRAHGVSVLSWGRDGPAEVGAAAALSVLEAARRTADLTVVDLSRSLDEPARAAAGRCGAVLVIVPGDVRGTAAATRCVPLLQELCPRVELVVRVVRGGLSPSSVAAAVGAPLAGRLPEDREAAAAADRGDPPGLDGRGPVAALCRDLLARTG